jgi:hypothetical protein
MKKKGDEICKIDKANEYKIIATPFLFSPPLNTSPYCFLPLSSPPIPKCLGKTLSYSTDTGIKVESVVAYPVLSALCNFSLL